MLTNDMVLELVGGLVAIFDGNIQQIILYGSFARKEETPESDVDIAIILQKGISDDKRNEFLEWAAELDMKYEKVFSIVDIESQKMERWGNVLSFYQNIRKEGIVLWKAA